MKDFLTFGLPLGSALVLVAALNSAFALHSTINFVELITVTSNFTARDHLFYLGTVLILNLLTVYLWIFVIFKGRSGHLSIWIAGSMLLLLLKIVISSWTLLVFLTTKDTLYWRKLWNLIIDIGLEVYLISIAVHGANVLWQKTDFDCGYSQPSQTHQNSQNFQNFDTNENPNYEFGYCINADIDPYSLRERNPPLIPVGLSVKNFLGFYLGPNHTELTARIFIILDVIFSAYILITLKLPEMILAKRQSLDEIEPILNSNLSSFGEKTMILILLEDNLLRLIRILTGLVGIYILTKKGSTASNLGKVTMANILLVTFSMIIYFALFGLFEELSTSDRFYQTTFTLDIAFRLLIVYFLTQCVDNRRLRESAGLVSAPSCSDTNGFCSI